MSQSGQLSFPANPRLKLWRICLHRPPHQPRFLVPGLVFEMVASNRVAKTASLMTLSRPFLMTAFRDDASLIGPQEFLVGH